jgi:hypothetical protein
VGTEQGVACRKRECKRVWLQRWMQLEVIAIALPDDDASTSAAASPGEPVSLCTARLLI